MALPATTIGFADEVHPSQEKKADDVTATNTAVEDNDNSIYTRAPKRTLTGRSTSSEDNKDGIYNMRDITRTFSRSTSKGRSATWNWKRGDKEAGRRKSSTAGFCFGCPTSPLVPFTATLEPVLSMSILPLLKGRLVTRILSESCPLSFGL